MKSQHLLFKPDPEPTTEDFERMERGEWPDTGALESARCYELLSKDSIRKDECIELLLMSSPFPKDPFLGLERRCSEDILEAIGGGKIASKQVGHDCYIRPADLLSFVAQSQGKAWYPFVPLTLKVEAENCRPAAAFPDSAGSASVADPSADLNALAGPSDRVHSPSEYRPAQNTRPQTPWDFKKLVREQTKAGILQLADEICRGAGRSKRLVPVMVIRLAVYALFDANNQPLTLSRRTIRRYLSEHGVGTGVPEKSRASLKKSELRVWEDELRLPSGLLASFKYPVKRRDGEKNGRGKSAESVYTRH